MAYDEELAERVRGLLRDELDVTERSMFGGLAFLVNGNMSVTVSGRGGLLVRLDPEDAAALIDGDVVTEFAMKGSPMRGWVRVSEAGYAADDQLRDWVDRSVEFARTLPHR